MNVNKQFLKTLLAGVALVFVGSVHAGSEGVHAYYGLGLGGVVIDEASGYAGLDAAPLATVFVGVEEDGWAFEILGMRTAEAGTDTAGTDWMTTGTIMSLGYRTVEENRSYYKFVFGKADTDMDLITGNVTATGSIEGNVYTLGWGKRLRQGNRIEVDYSYYDPDSQDAPFIKVVHMITMRYLFGGSPFEKH
jgi:hypothetical protein